MDLEDFYNEIKQFNHSTSPAIDMKETIVLYPYFMLAQLIQAKKNTIHLFNLNVLFPNRQYLYELLHKNTKIVNDNLELLLSEKNKEEIRLSSEIEKKEEILCCLNEESISLDELIEKFNTNCPKIICNIEQLKEEEAYEDLCKSSVAEKMNIVSETLANVYVEQKSYDKAIKIYKTLMVRYPEKSSIFANLIEELKDIKSSQQN